MNCKQILVVFSQPWKSENTMAIEPLSWGLQVSPQVLVHREVSREERYFISYFSQLYTILKHYFFFSHRAFWKIIHHLKKTLLYLGYYTYNDFSPKPSCKRVCKDRFNSNEWCVGTSLSDVHSTWRDLGVPASTGIWDQLGLDHSEQMMFILS